MAKAMCCSDWEGDFKNEAKKIAIPISKKMPFYRITLSWPFWNARKMCTKWYGMRFCYLP